MSSFGMRNPPPAPKPVMKPASNITSFDNRKGTGKSLGGDDDVSASLASSADFDHITPLSSMNELELKNAKIEFLEGKWKKNVSRLGCSVFNLESITGVRMTQQVHSSSSEDFFWQFFSAKKNCEI